MDEWQTKLIEQAGPLGAALGVVVLAAGAVVARTKGWIGLGTQPKDKDQKSEANGEIMTELRLINTRLGKFDERLGKVEQDLSTRPTHKDMHQLEVSLARMDERMGGLDRTTTATNASVIRIEEFLYQIASGK